MITVNGKTFDAATLMAPFVNTLEKLDPALYLPLYNVTWQRDIQLREDVNLGMEMTSFIRSKIAAIGSQGYAGIPWYNGTKIPGVSVDGEKIGHYLRVCAQEVCYDAIELARSQMLNQPIDRQKFDALNVLYQMSCDEYAYIGSTATGSTAETGLLNSSIVEYDLVTTGVSGYTWALKTPLEIQKDINDILSKAWQNSGYTVVPRDLLINPVNFGLIAGKPMSDLSVTTVLEFVSKNNLCMAENGVPLNIKPCKWCTGRGQSSYNRMLAYTNDPKYVRMVMVPIRAEQAYYEGISFHRPYIWALGGIEIVKPETMIYRDEI
jgi:hypothetical protein